jgi:hypothetical protein
MVIFFKIYIILYLKLRMPIIFLFSFFFKKKMFENGKAKVVRRLQLGLAIRVVVSTHLVGVSTHRVSVSTHLTNLVKNV